MLSTGNVREHMHLPHTSIPFPSICVFSYLEVVDVRAGQRTKFLPTLVIFHANSARTQPPLRRRRHAGSGRHLQMWVVPRGYCCCTTTAAAAAACTSTTTTSSYGLAVSTLRLGVGRHRHVPGGLALLSLPLPFANFAAGGAREGVRGEAGDLGVGGTSVCDRHGSMREDEANQVVGVRKERGQTLREGHVMR